MSTDSHVPFTMIHRIPEILILFFFNSISNPKSTCALILICEVIPFTMIHRIPEILIQFLFD
ncbi:unnamed protein product [Amoebophrya sp. A25]|nr:unnamed protein product [Amoebophrya sp. A25]|eukprot:GSA25T00002399001.1